MSFVQPRVPLPRGGRYVTLDAMRGVAAIFVVYWHLGIEAKSTNLPTFSYLAVDVFFVLSGFVLAHAFDKRFAAGLTFRDFMVQRWLRLAPPLGLGVVLGVCAHLAAPTSHLSLTQSLPTALANALAVPVPIHGFTGHTLFPLNPPFWSLFFELWVANLVFGLFWRQLRGKALVALLLVSAVGLLVSERLFYTLNTGWEWSNLIGGVARVLYSFFIGVSLYRLHQSRSHGLTVPGIAVLGCLVVAFLVPLGDRPKHVFELFAVLIVFPALVYLGAGAKERHPRLGTLLGDASYATYTIHHPLVILASAFGATLIHGAVGQTVLVLAVVLLALGAAAADEKLRRRLQKRFRLSRSGGQDAEVLNVPPSR